MASAIIEFGLKGQLDRLIGNEQNDAGLDAIL